jgi:uncharacterized SAM-binding protein YcdF (DUF218 family)
MGFVLKKLISRLFFPLPLCAELLLLGLILSRFARTRRWGWGFLVAGTVALLMFSSYPVANRLLLPLEQHFPAFGEEQLTALAAVPPAAGAVQIAVMGNGYGTDATLPPLHRIGAELCDRLDEATRLYHLLEQAGIPAHLQISMSGKAPPAEIQAGLSAYLAQVAIPESAVTPHFGLLDSRQEIICFQQQLPSPDAPLILVSAASHIPRCIQIARALGLNPIAAPARPWIRDTDLSTPDMWFPNAEAMRRSERAIYAYIGILWTWARN